MGNVDSKAGLRDSRLMRSRFRGKKSHVKSNTKINRSEVDTQVRLLSILLDGLVYELEQKGESLKDIEILKAMKIELAATGRIREELRRKLQPNLMQYLDEAAVRALEMNDYGLGKSFTTERALTSDMTSSSLSKSENNSASVSFNGEVSVREYSFVEDSTGDELNDSFLRRLSSKPMNIVKGRRNSLDDVTRVG